MTDSQMNDGLVASKPPKPALSIGRNRVYLAIAILGLSLTAIIVANKGQPKPKVADSGDQTGRPGYNVTRLASSYADLPVPTAVPVARAQLRLRENDSSNADMLLAKLAEERRKRAEQARRSSLSFQNVSLSRINELDSLPKSEGSAPGPAASEGESASNPRDESNRQDEKAAFLEKVRSSDTALSARVLRPRSPYQLMAGTIIPGLLITGLNSDLPGQILGQVSQNVYDSAQGKHLLIPQGTKIIGQYDSRVVYGQSRALIVWTRLVFPNSKSISLEGMPGVDLSGYAGLSDQVNNHWGQIITGVAISSLLSAGTQIAQGRNYSSFDPSYDELATQGVARNANQVGQAITRRSIDVQPTLEIRPGFRFNVFVHKDLILEPYTGRN